jgi:gliding motility-associated protein GldM
MSIPKEPRQLMINLMYLVLTAMLALNVSAEIINAFFALNKGLKTSSGIVATSNENMMKGIDKVANAYRNPTNQAYQGRAVEAQKISAEFEAYIKGVTDELIEAAGGVDKTHADGRPVRYKDKDVTTNLFLSEGQGKGRGAEIEKKIQEMRDRFLKLSDDADRKAMADQIALQVDSIPSDSKAKNWAELKFKQMPVAAVMPMLSKLVNDAKTSETTLLNYFLKKVNGETEIRLDEFRVAIAPKKSYLIRGDKFEADIYLAAYSKNPGANISISANGSGLPLRDGVAHYETTPGGIGKQTVNATASIRNPLTGLTKETKGTFEYEVGEKSGTISAEKMNVFYIGVTNPVAISAAGVSSNSLRLNCTGCESLNKKNDNNYDITVNRPGEATLTMTGDGGFTVSKKFRVKQIPDPYPITTFNKKGGLAGSGEMASFGGLIAKLDNFDFEAKCSIQSYVLFRVPRREDPQQVNVNNATSPEAQRICQLAKPGDSYQFLEIKARCPGDGAARSIGSLSFVIK